MPNKPTYEELESRIEELERLLQGLGDARESLPERVERYERFTNTVPCTFYDYVLWPDGRSQLLYISPQCERIFELDAPSILKDTELLWSMLSPDEQQRMKRMDRAANDSGQMFTIELHILLPSGNSRWIEMTSMPSNKKVDGQVVWSGFILDITRRKLAEEEKDRLLEELRQALAEVKTLRGILPICCHCKKIRDDKGYWEQLEAYLSEHAEVGFSHGICPECMKKYYPEVKIEEE